MPFQQAYNFYQGTEDALNFFLSAANPGLADLDTARVGLAGHSLGASAVSEIGQCDPRVSAIVAWDNLAPTTGACADKAKGLPAGGPAQPTLDVPALGINSEYFFNVTPQQSVPNAQAGSKAFEQLAAAGTDAMQIGLRASTHLEYTYVPYILPASRLGERVAFYYSLAWFDRYLKGDPSAFGRLTATTFDASADASSIGAGTYDPARGAGRPDRPRGGQRALPARRPAGPRPRLDLQHVALRHHRAGRRAGGLREHAQGLRRVLRHALRAGRGLRRRGRGRP